MISTVGRRRLAGHQGFPWFQDVGKVGFRAVSRPVGWQMMTERPAIVALTGSGWSPARSVDISDDLAAFAREGIPVFNAVADFLRVHSGLVVNFDRGGDPDQIWFSGLRAVQQIATAWIEDYSRRSGVRVAPVGAAYREHLTLLIGADGSWYGGYDDEFGALGLDFLDALENLLLVDGFIERF